MLALLNASSFPLKAVVCAVAVGHSPTLNRMILNPKEELETSGCFVFLFGADDELEETIWTDWKSSGRPELMNEAREVARIGAREVHKSIKASIGH
jgi:exosome complex component RRP46